MANARQNAPIGLVAIVSWLLPGSGYWLIGERVRGTTIGVTVLALFLLGVLFAGWRVIDVPGWDASGRAILVRGEKKPSFFYDSVLFRRPLAEIASKPWSAGQVLAGPVFVLAASRSISASETVGRPHARIAEIGTLYTAVAGMLNLLAIIDVIDRAGRGATK